MMLAVETVQCKFILDPQLVLSVGSYVFHNNYDKCQKCIIIAIEN